MAVDDGVAPVLAGVPVGAGTPVINPLLFAVVAGAIVEDARGSTLSSKSLTLSHPSIIAVRLESPRYG